MGTVGRAVETLVGLSLVMCAWSAPGCTASSTGSVPQQNTPPATTKPYPNIALADKNGSSYVYWDGEPIVEIRQNRYLCFRATRFDEKWLGNDKKSMDLGWAYNDKSVNGLEVLSVQRENYPDKGCFVIRIKGKKPTFDCRNDIVLTGTWMGDVGKFRYNLHTELQCPLETWYQNSAMAARAAASHPTLATKIEPLDYHVEYMSMPDRIASATHKDPQMYPWFAKSNDGAAWAKLPKVHIPYPTRPGNYITIHDDPHPTPVGGYFGFLDPQYGGWMMRVVKSPVPVTYGLCWTYFDVHVELLGAVPPRGSQKDLSLDLELAFDPVEAPRCRQIIQQAAEIPWRTGMDYRLPLLSLDKENRFDKLICDLPGEETANQYVWWASSAECDRDDAVGFDDHYSVTIKREKPSPMPAGWNTWTLGPCFTGKSIGGHRFRFSAMVKTANCAGPVRLAHAALPDEAYYARYKTHNADGTPMQPDIWAYSPPVSGTVDWTPITMEFIAGHTGRDIVVLEQRGIGQSWFDNVRIEDLGQAEPQKAKK